MESIRALVGMKSKTGASDEEIFTEEITLLLEPHMDVTMQEFRTELQESGGIYLGTSEEFFKEINRRLLKKFFALAKTDTGLNKFMIPIMMYLRSARMKRGVR